MLSEKYNVTVADIDTELDVLHKSFLASKKVLNYRLHHLQDIAQGQAFLMKLGSPPEGSTIASVSAEIAGLEKVVSARKRHLNAFKKILKDEAEERADANQAKLPVDDQPPPY